MARLIPLTRGRVAQVDEDDYARIRQHKWRYMTNGYAAKEDATVDKKESILMHHEILWCPEGFEVDHINGDKLDNTKANLRVCTRGENQRNVPKLKNNKSGYKGVTFDRWTGRWVAKIGHKGKHINLGRYKTPELAAKAYDRAAIEYHGEFASLNFPQEVSHSA